MSSTVTSMFLGSGLIFQAGPDILLLNVNNVTESPHWTRPHWHHGISRQEQVYIRVMSEQVKHKATKTLLS